MCDFTSFDLAQEFTKHFAIQALRRYYDVEAKLKGKKLGGKEIESSSKPIEAVTAAVVSGSALASGVPILSTVARLVEKPLGLAVAEIVADVRKERYKKKWKHPFYNGIKASVYHVDPSEVKRTLSQTFVQGGAELAVIFEPQLLAIQAKYSSTHELIFESLAYDAAHRTVIDFHSFTKEFSSIPCRLVYGVLHGTSKPINKKGGTITNKFGVDFKTIGWNSADLFSTVGLHHDQEGQYYRRETNDGSKKYRHRRPTLFELENNAEVEEHFIKDNPPTEDFVPYKLNFNRLQEIEQTIFRIVMPMEFGGVRSGVPPSTDLTYNIAPFGSPPCKLPGLEKITIETYAPRTNEVKILKAIYDNRANLPTPIAVIYGMGAIGKSKFCRIFIKDLNSSRRYPAVISWLQSKDWTELKEFMEEQSSNEELPPSKNRSIEAEIRFMVTNIAVGLRPEIVNSDWIVVFDNVLQEFDELYTTIQDFIAQGAFVIVTSRIPLYGDEIPDQLVRLGAICKDEATSLVKQLLYPSLDISAHDKELLSRMGHLLGHHSLLLSRGVAYIKQKRSKGDKTYSVTNFCDKFHEIKKELLPSVFKSSTYKDTVPLILDHAFLAIAAKLSLNEKNLSQDIMKIASVLGPDGITPEFLNKLFCHVHPDENAVLDPTLDLLNEFCLLDVDTDRILVNPVTQEAMKLRDDFDWEKIIEALLTLDQSAFQKEEVKSIHGIWLHAAQCSEILKKRIEQAIKLHERMASLPEFDNYMTSFETAILGKDLVGPYGDMKRHNKFKDEIRNTFKAETEITLNGLNIE